MIKKFFKEVFATSADFLRELFRTTMVMLMLLFILAVVFLLVYLGAEFIYHIWH